MISPKVQKFKGTSPLGSSIHGVIEVNKQRAVVRQAWVQNFCHSIWVCVQGALILKGTVMRIKAQRRSMFLPRGDGPFQVLKRINENAYKLDFAQ